MGDLLSNMTPLEGLLKLEEVHGKIALELAIKLYKNRKRSVDTYEPETFPKWIKEVRYKDQKGICVFCGGFFLMKQVEADHIVPQADGGETTLENCQVLCKPCNRKKSSKGLNQMSKETGKLYTEQL